MPLGISFTHHILLQVNELYVDRVQISKQRDLKIISEDKIIIGQSTGECYVKTHTKQLQLKRIKLKLTDQSMLKLTAKLANFLNNLTGTTDCSTSEFDIKVE